MIQQRNKREGESTFIPHSTAWMKRSQGDMMEQMRNDYSIPRDFIHLAESVTDWADSPSDHKSASHDWDEVFDQTQEIIQSQLGIQRKLVEMIDGLDLGEEAVLRLRKVVDSAIDRTIRISELKGSIRQNKLAQVHQETRWIMDAIRDEMMREKQNRSSRSIEMQSDELQRRLSQTEKQAMIKQNQLMQAEQELQRTREEKDACCLENMEFREMARRAESQLQECRDKKWPGKFKYSRLSR